MNKYTKPLFAAFNAGLLMSGNRGLSDSQKQDLFFLKEKSLGKILHKRSGNPLKITDTEKKRMATLLETSKQTYHQQMNKTAKGVVRSLYAKLEYGYRKDLGNLPQIKKGRLVEQDILDLIMVVYPEFGKLVKEQIFKKNSHFIGICDTITNPLTIPQLNIEEEEIVIDVKASSDFHSFFNLDIHEKTDPVYYGQLQIYMDLYGLNHAALIYGLVSTPTEIIESLIKKASWDFGGIEKAQFNPDFLKIKNNIIQQNTFDWIPPEDRIKAIFFQKDEEYLKELKYRIENGAWLEYDILTLKSDRFYQKNSLGNIQALLDAADLL